MDKNLPFYMKQFNPSTPIKHYQPSMQYHPPNLRINPQYSIQNISNSYSNQHPPQLSQPFHFYRQFSKNYTPPPMTFCQQNFTLQYRKFLMEMRNSSYFNPQNNQNAKYCCSKNASHNYDYNPNFCQNQSYSRFNLQTSYKYQQKHDCNLVKLQQPQIEEIPYERFKYQTKGQYQKQSKIYDLYKRQFDSGLMKKNQKSKIRRAKVISYLQKRKNRTFDKKIIYECRKQVADNRIRHLGRFMNINQAKQILGIENDEKISIDEIKRQLKLRQKQKHKQIVKKSE